MFALICIGAAIVLAAGAMCCFRIGGWHQKESDYWYDVALRVRLDPAQEATYRPILDWAKSNEPSLWGRMRSWQSPRVRMMDAAR